MLASADKSPYLIATDRRAQGPSADVHRRQCDLVIRLSGLVSHAIHRMAGQQQMDQGTQMQAAGWGC